MEYVLEREQRVPRSRAEVFPFFAEARNLERLTPPFMKFEFETRGRIAMEPGALIDYRIQLFGFSMQWQTRIEAFFAPMRFVDVQLKGPYKRWHHTHEFHEIPGGTLLTDRVVYDIGRGALGELARVLFVRRTLEKIFDYRYQTIADLFGTM
jgi:ligand-binding SRPBCC domain-containing protein